MAVIPSRWLIASCPARPGTILQFDRAQSTWRARTTHGQNLSTCTSRAGGPSDGAAVSAQSRLPRQFSFTGASIEDFRAEQRVALPNAATGSGSQHANKIDEI